MEIFNCNTISENNQKLFLNVIYNFFMIKKMYFNEYSNRSKDPKFVSEIKKKINNDDTIQEIPKVKFMLSDCQCNELSNFGYSSFGHFFFNNFYFLTEDIDIKIDENVISIDISQVKSPKHLRLTSDIFAFNNIQNNLVINNSFRKIINRQKICPLDSVYKYFFNVKLVNWKITILQLKKLNLLNSTKKLTCRICKEKVYCSEFIMHIYNCQEKKKNINELSTRGQFLIELSIKLRKIKK